MPQMLPDGEPGPPVLHIGQILTGRKGAAASRQHNTTHRFIPPGFFERLLRLRNHRVIKRVQFVGAVEGDGGNTILDSIEDVFVAHGVYDWGFTIDD